MSIDSHMITKFAYINLIEFEESKPLLEDREFKKNIFHFYFLNTNIFFVSLGTLIKISKTYRKHSVVVNCVSHFYIWHSFCFMKLRGKMKNILKVSRFLT